MQKLAFRQIKNIKKKIDVSLNKLIILLAVTDDKDVSIDELNKNIYCVNSDYEIIWQVKHEVEPGFFEEDPFININFDGKNLVARDFSGFDFLIDLQNGEIKKTIAWNK